MKRTVVISKSSIEQEFKRIKDKFYGKLVTNKVDQAFILKNYFNVERIYVDDTLDENRNGKSIYIVFSDGKEEQVSVSQILKQK
jgi:hypothetical protein